MGAYTFTKNGQFIYKGKIYTWSYNGDTETMLVKNAGDEVLRYKIEFPKCKYEVASEYIKQRLNHRPDPHNRLTFEPF